MIKEITDFDSIYSDRDAPSGTVTAIEVVDSVVIMMHGEDDRFFSFVDVENGRLLKKWGNPGNGRNEYVRLGAEFSVEDSALVFRDEARLEVNHVPLRDILDETVLYRFRMV